MLKEYLLRNIEELEKLVYEIHWHNGALEHLVMYENDEEFFNTFFTNKPMEAVRSAYYGEYDYNDEYVRFNGYANLESYDEWEYESLLRNHVEEVIRELRSIKDECHWVDEKIMKMLDLDETNEQIFKGMFLRY